MKRNQKSIKEKWQSVIQKKWFFPALYLTVAALLLSVVVSYQNVGNQLPQAFDDVTDEYTPNFDDDELETVAEKEEIVQLPVASLEGLEVVTKFFDYEAKEEDQQAALILHNNRYYQSTGIGIASNNEESFDVVASLSGEVKEVKEDPLLGNIVVIDHKDDIETYYASLGEVFVEAGDRVQQSDVIASAGQNLFMKENGIHVHFEIHHNGVEVNPEDAVDGQTTDVAGLVDSAGDQETGAEQDEASEEADE